MDSSIKDAMVKSVIKFLKNLKPDEVKEYFLKRPTSKTLSDALPSPRTWETVINILQLDLTTKETKEMLEGAIGKEAADKFYEQF